MPVKKSKCDGVFCHYSETEGFKTKIIVSSATLNKAHGAYLTRSLGHVAVKGKIDKVTICALDGIGNPSTGSG
ncbi:MAG: hypothetical protein HQK97_04060 [Nitrospirae bacterium]|nr:hypothetical protein [Nitrospirota bacterium]